MAYVYRKEDVLVVQIRDGSRNFRNSIIIFLNDNLNVSNQVIDVSNDEVYVESIIFPVILNNVSQP